MLRPVLARLLAGVLASAVVLAASPNVARADDEENAPRITASDFEGAIRGGFVPGILSGSGKTQVIMKLSDDPVALEQAKAGRKLDASEKSSIKNRLKGKQDSLDAGIATAGGRVLAKYQSAYNGIRVEIDRSAARSLASLPGVVAVLEVERMERTNSLSVPFIGAPAAWSGVAGVRGEGVKVAIIDTGIDYTHATFGGPGTEAAYDVAHAAEAAPADPALFGPAAPKVKGGIDLVGDAYDGNNTPQPDANPLDCNGHGSHVAGTAAGFGVKADGTTYAGSYDSSTHSSNTFKVGPGVAPKADLYAVRVFGCEGSTRVTVDAIEWAVDNDMDVINMSLGAAFTGNDQPSSEASNNAALAGVIVVASSGNNGAAQYITGAPGSATRVIGTAAMDTVSPATFPNVTLTLTPGPGSIVAQVSNGVTITHPTTWSVVVLRNADGTVSLGCDPDEYVGVTGKLVVTQRGECARVARAVFGQKAGAAAVAMINNATSLPPFEGKITGNPDTGEVFEVTIPFLGVRGLAATPGTDGNRLQASTSVVTSPAAPSNNPAFRAPAGFTSGGPRIWDSWLKPDVSAPGVNIVSAGVGSGNQGATFSGTSMAAPHTAGVAALVRQVNPTWTSEQVKAAIVNTADPGKFAQGFRQSRAGSGLVQPERATKTRNVAVGDPGTASLSYGFAEISANYSATKQITITNSGTSAATFVPSSVPNSTFTRTHTVAFSPASVTVAAGASATLDVTLSISIGNVGNSTGTSTNPGGYREATGSVVLTPQGGANSGIALRVPYLFVPRALSNLATTLAGRLDPETPTQATTTNTGGITGSADYYAWGLEDANDGIGTADLRAAGVQSFGADFLGGSFVGKTLLVFAINTYVRWNNAAINEFDIAVEAGGDGKTSFIVFSADGGLVTTGTRNGISQVFIFNTATRAIRSSGFLATARTDSSTILLPLIAEDLGVSRTGNSKFRYSVASFPAREDGQDSIHGKASYDVDNGGATQGMFYNVAAGSSTTVTITAEEGVSGITPNLGIMIVTIDNAAGATEAQLISVPGQ